MTRINRDPYTGGHFFALANRVTCLLDNEEAVAATVRALEEDGVATDDIDIFTGEEGARALDLSGREHGRVVRLLRTLEAVVGEERETTHRIDEDVGGVEMCGEPDRGPSDGDGRVGAAFGESGRDGAPAPSVSLVGRVPVEAAGQMIANPTACHLRQRQVEQLGSIGIGIAF